jgi:erythronate-4-phosphate dehydrogenase
MAYTAATAQHNEVTFGYHEQIGIPMRIVVDENIASLPQTFASHGELVARAGRAITAADVREADALIVRSVTKVDESLLAGSRVKFVGSCTIGTDHVDVEYLERAGIRFVHAPGCNARAVAEYVITALCRLLGDPAQWQARRAGIVGFGNVGRQLAQLFDALRIEWVAHDPLIAQPDARLVPFEEIFRCDIVSLHVPLSKAGTHATWHLFDRSRLQSLSPHAVLVNTSRGAVIDNGDLKSVLTARKAPTVVLDVFENEPAIDVALFDEVRLATPHIAGYSVQGKQRGTWQVYRSFCDAFGIAAAVTQQEQVEDLDCTDCASVADVILRAYDIAADDARLRQYSGDIAVHFDLLRKHYPSRFEWGCRRLVNRELSRLQPAALATLQSLGFRT